jgi:hypothetical protein
MSSLEIGWKLDYNSLGFMPPGMKDDYSFVERHRVEMSNIEAAAGPWSPIIDHYTSD